MNTLILPQRVFCDESGFTGDNMLDSQQPFFTYASVAMDEKEAEELVQGIRLRHRKNGSELKGARLMRSHAGRAVSLEILRAMRGRYLVTAYDKKLSLAGKFFEYVFEPVLGVCAVGRLAPRKTGDVLPKVQPGIPDGISGNGRFQIPASARFSIVRVRVLSRFPGINPPVAFASA